MFFVKVKKIKSFHYFFFNGDLSVKQHSEANSETQHLLCLNPEPEAFPHLINPEGLSQQRQWYLFEEIRQFVSEFKQDSVAPKPWVGEPDTSSKDDEILPLAKKAKGVPVSWKIGKNL